MVYTYLKAGMWVSYLWPGGGSKEKVESDWEIREVGEEEVVLCAGYVVLECVMENRPVLGQWDLWRAHTFATFEEG